MIFKVQRTCQVQATCNLSQCFSCRNECLRSTFKGVSRQWGQTRGQNVLAMLLATMVAEGIRQTRVLKPGC